MLLQRLLLAATALLPLGITAGAGQFEEATGAAGLTDSGAYCFAAAWGDYDNDGFPDLFIAAGGDGSRTNLFYHNARNGRFTPVEPAAGPVVTNERDSFGCAWVDFNNDGHRDLLVINGPWSASRNDLHWNQGNGTFTSGSVGELTSQALVWSWPACADYDGDGWTDVYLAGANLLAGPFTNRLYRASGQGTFTPMDLEPPIAYANGAVWGDYDSDGDPDLFNSNAYVPSTLLRNNGDGQFSGMTNGLPADAGTLNAAWADYDGDGDLDIALSGFTDTRVYRNDGTAGFVQAATLSGAFGCPTWADYDNDGRPDLLAAMGQNATTRAVLYHNDGNGTFNAVEDAMSGSLENWLGSAWADYDNDGGMDVVLFHQYGRNRLYHNLRNGNHWLKLRLAGTVSNRDAIGAKVRVLATISGQAVWQMQEVSGGYQVQHDIRPHFGLGDATKVDRVRIEWPSGIVQELTELAADQILTVWEPPVLAAAMQSDGSCVLRIRAEPERAWQVQASSDLVDWQTIETITSASREFEYRDPTTGAAQRFYRLRGE